MKTLLGKRVSFYENGSKLVGLVTRNPIGTGPIECRWVEVTEADGEKHEVQVCCLYM